MEVSRDFVPWLCKVLLKKDHRFPCKIMVTAGGKFNRIYSPVASGDNQIFRKNK
jgi:hypothetical protein